MTWYSTCQACAKQKGTENELKNENEFIPMNSLGDHSVKCHVVALGEVLESEISFFSQKWALFCVDLINGDIATHGGAIKVK